MTFSDTQNKKHSFIHSTNVCQALTAIGFTMMLIIKELINGLINKHNLSIPRAYSLKMLASLVIGENLAKTVLQSPK